MKSSFLHSLFPHMVVLTTLAFFVLFPTRHADALYSELHSLMAYEASFISGSPSEIRVYAGAPKTSVAPGSGICAGAYDEDAERDPRLTSGVSTWWGLLNWGTHFWNPAEGPGGGLLKTVETFPVNLEGRNAYQRARQLYETAKVLYGEDPPAAYHLLGRVVHLLTDMATPAHVHLDVHIADTSETGDDSLEEYTASRYVSPGLPAGLAAFETDFPLESLSSADLTNLADGGYPGEPLLFRLFYSMAETAGGFDSDDADGSLDKGCRRGKSVPVLHTDLTGAVLYGTGCDVRIPSRVFQMSPSRDKFVIPVWVFNAITGTGRFEGIRLDFADATEFHPLSEFSRTDIGDSDISMISNSLIPPALEHISALYRLFWDETHPAMRYDEMPLISFHSGAKALQINRPAPLEVELDIAPGSWNEAEVEAYLWLEFPVEDVNQKVYFDGQWKIFAAHSELRPVAQSFSLTPAQGSLLRLLDDTALLPEITLRLNLCADRALDGLYSPDESVCSSIEIQIQGEFD